MWVPPEAAWEPIQAIRRRHDRHVRRWMPHVTLLYPFRPREEFDALAPPLAEACRRVGPFEIELGELRHFAHGRRSFTIWLSPEPADAVRRLQRALQAVVPDCDDTRGYRGGFTPHLSVGQARDHKQAALTVAALQREWAPLQFRASEVQLIWRNEPPDDVFRIGHRIRLGTEDQER